MTSATETSPLPKKSITISYFLSELILGMFSALGGPALPFLADNTASSLERISLFFVLGSLGYLLGSFFGGRAYDRVPGHRLMAFTLLIVAGSGALIPLMGLLWWLLLAQFTLGLAQGVNDAGCNTQLLWLHGKQSGPYMNGLHFFFGLGTTLAPLLLAGTLSLAGDIQWAYWVCAVLAIPLAIWFWTLPEIPPAQKPAHSGKSPGTALAITLLVLAFTFAVGAEFGFGNWIYTHALRLDLGTVITSAYLTSAFWATFTLGRLAGIWIAARLQPFKILILDLAGCLLSIGLILINPRSEVLLWLGTIGSGLAMASIFPTLLALAGERLTITGSVTGWMLFGGGLGGMFFPWLIGQSPSGWEAAAMPTVVAVTAALNLVVLLLFNSRTAKQPQG